MVCPKRLRPKMVLGSRVSSGRIKKNKIDVHKILTSLPQVAPLHSEPQAAMQPGTANLLARSQSVVCEDCGPLFSECIECKSWNVSILFSFQIIYAFHVCGVTMNICLSSKQHFVWIIGKYISISFAGSEFPENIWYTLPVNTAW